MRKRQKGFVETGIVLLLIAFVAFVDIRRTEVCPGARDCPDFPAKAQAQK